jgi:hypothetical protein
VTAATTGKWRGRPVRRHHPASMLDCEKAGDFEDFSVEGHSAQYAAYYTE